MERDELLVRTVALLAGLVAEARDMAAGHGRWRELAKLADEAQPLLYAAERLHKAGGEPVAPFTRDDAFHLAAGIVAMLQQDAPTRLAFDRAAFLLRDLSSPQSGDPPPPAPAASLPASPPAAEAPAPARHGSQPCPSLAGAEASASLRSHPSSDSVAGVATATVAEGAGAVMAPASELLGGILDELWAIRRLLAPAP